MIPLTAIYFHSTELVYICFVKVVKLGKYLNKISTVNSKIFASVYFRETDANMF